MSTLFERLGGEPAVDAAVDIFYEKVIADERISAFFEHLDMFAQANKQKKFLTMAFGGPNDYSGKDMRTAHAHLGATEEHFAAVVENLMATLEQLGVSAEDQAEVGKITDSVKDDVLNR
ncbi:MAG: group 1 truncated hemoglobin [Halioglobus sp.]